MSAAAVLTIRRDGETLKSCPIEGEMILGRSEDCLIRLEDRAISRKHAVFRAVEDGDQVKVHVEKKSEFAPLIVNGQERTQAVLDEGDVVAIGPYLMQVSFGQEELAAAVDGAKPAETPEAPEMAGVFPAARDHRDSNSDGDAGPAGLLPESSLGLASADALMERSRSLLEGARQEAGPQGGGWAPLSESPDPGGGMPSDGLRVPDSGPLSAGESPSYGGENDSTRIASPKKLAAMLYFEEGAANFREFEISQEALEAGAEISIGRGKNCDIVLNDQRASRSNAVIKRDGRRFIIKDLGSANGTYVNGIRVEEHELGGEDRIRIGDVEFDFKILSADYLARAKELPPVGETSSSGHSEQNPAFAFQPPPPGGFPERIDFGTQQNEFPAADGLPQGIPSDPPPLGEGLAPSDAPAAEGVDGIAGIAGLGAGMEGKPRTLMEKFRALPTHRQYIWIVIVVGLLYFLLFDEDEAPVKARKAVKKPVATASPTPGSGQNSATFESLSPEQKKFIEAQHRLAFEYFKNQDYDKALFELGKIFALVPDYKDSRDIERYAQEGKRRLEAKEEEKRRKAEEARLKARVQELENEARQKMKKGQYELAKELFPQILELDPENAEVEKWKEQIEQAEEDQRIALQKEEVRKEINRQAWQMYRDGLRLKRAGKLNSAIAVFNKIRELGPGDPQVSRLARQMAAKCREEIRVKREPLMEEARQLENSGELGKAFQIYMKIARLDPYYPEAITAMHRVRQLLHDRAKVLYTEAVLAESYSDFSTARKKYEDILFATPKDDIYYERAQRKIARLFKQDDSGS